MNANRVPSGCAGFVRYGCFFLQWMVGMVSAAELGVAELSFDKRYETPASMATVERPAWVTGVEQAGGTFLDEPGCWQVPGTAADGSGRLTISLDRSRISGDVAATVLFSAEQSSDIAVQLFDNNGRAVVVDLFGNLIDVGGALSTNTFVISLNKYPTATRIVLRQVHGPVTVYGVVLFPVATEGEMVMDEMKKLARRLGDPLSAENPIVKNLRQLADNANAVITTSAEREPTVKKSGQSLASLAKTRPAACMMMPKNTSMAPGCVCGPAAKTAVVFTDPPVIESPIKFSRPVTVLVEDSHGGTDIFNEYNFGSAQLGRILTAQGATVSSTRNASGFSPATGLTRAVLDRFDVVIFNGRFNGRTKPFTAEEIQAVEGWVRDGGGLMVTCNSPTASDHMDAFYMNPLIAPFGLQFASRELRTSYFPVKAEDRHPIVQGLSGFYVFHGTAVAGQAEAHDVLPSARDAVMMAQKVGKGRVIAFGAGSAIQNQALNSRVIHQATQQTRETNTRLAMNLALWLSGVDEVVSSN